MANKDLRKWTSNINMNKLDTLSNTLKRALSSEDFYTVEQYVSEAAKILRQNARSRNEPIKDNSVLPEIYDMPSSEDYNNMFGNIRDSLQVLFYEFENIEDMAIAGFNYAITGSNRANSVIKKINSLINDYELYTQKINDIIIVHDTFNNTDKIDEGSQLLAGDECYYNTPEGIVTLPINTASNVPIQVIKTPTIDSSSNGTAGNNEELGLDWNGNLRAILDDNADTWFEYERVVTSDTDDEEPLKLALTITLEEEKPINYIRINPQNFGTRVAIDIESIETSTDGISYLNVKDDIAAIAYFVDDEPNIFKLSPAASKFAGQGVYTFTPRKTKFIKLIFKQSEPYTIDTVSGEKLRYAIGIRDIDIRAISYGDKGEFISSAIEMQSPVSKIALETAQNIEYGSEVGSIKYFISPDDGSTWNELRPLKDIGVAGQVADAPEILNYNNAAENAIDTITPVTKVRFKAILERKNEAFTDDGSALPEEVVFNTEVHNIPSNNPHIIKLSNAPLKGTVQVVAPAFGSVGDERFAYIISDGTAKRTLPIPKWTNLNSKRPWKKTNITGNLYKTETVDDSEWINVHVSGWPWSSITQAWTNYGGSDKVYEIDWKNSLLRFGDDTDGKIPEDGAKISMFFEQEKLYATKGANSPVSLNFATGSNKGSFTIERYEPNKTGKTKVAKGEVVYHLDHKNIVSVSTTIASTEKDYVNGRDEFTGSDQWSLDAENGIIYKTEPSTTITEIEYTYTPINTLSSSDWEWATNNTLNDSIKIKEDAWQTNDGSLTLSASDLNLLRPVADGGAGTWDIYNYSLHLPNLSIVKKTLQFTPTVASEDLNPFLQEVPFINGVTELTGAYTDKGLYSVDYDKGRIFTQRKLSGMTGLSVTYKYSDFRVKYKIAKLINPEDYEINYDKKEIKFDSEKLLEDEIITKDAQDKYQVNYDYIKSHRKDLAALKDYFTIALRDYILKIVLKDS